MLHKLNNLATVGNDGTQEIVIQLKHYLDYYPTNPESTALCQANTMVLQKHSNAAYLVLAGAKSQSGGYKYLENRDENTQFNNRPVSIIVKLIKHIMTQAAKAEITALIINTRDLLPLRKNMCQIRTPIIIHINEN